MSNDCSEQPKPGPGFGSSNLQLPDGLRAPLLAHLEHLRCEYLKLGWGHRVGFGKRPALVVIDLALFWTQPGTQMGSGVDSVVDETCKVLTAARSAKIPIFFTTFDFDSADPPSPHHEKLHPGINPENAHLLELDPRLEHRPNEKIIRKKYASCFNATNFNEMLTGLGVDTLIVTGVSTSHCVYATCRDATNSFRVIVPKSAVGERCEILHEVNLLDIDIDLGDVTPLDEVVESLNQLRHGNDATKYSH